VPLFERLADEDFAYLTTIGRTSGKPHRIEIWFAVDGRRLYLLSGGGDAADWVKNLRRNGRVRVQVGTRSVAARARIARAGAEDRHARELLDAKYMSWEPGKRLSSWAREAVPVAIDLPAR
jgi:deazaflavin-dependent oxidoreductase (nitroreductase family)